jgi:hypothetical protein
MAKLRVAIARHNLMSRDKASAPAASACASSPASRISHKVRKALGPDYGADLEVADQDDFPAARYRSPYAEVARFAVQVVVGSIGLLALVVYLASCF